MRDCLIASDRIAVHHLPDHPFVHLQDKEIFGPGHTVWMVTRTPVRWRRVIFREPIETLIVEIRPHGGSVVWPTGRAAPLWALSAVERGQDGSLERADIAPTAPKLQLCPTTSEAKP